MRFEVGQLVRLANKKARGMGADIGALAVVTKRSSCGVTKVEWIRGSKAKCQGNGAYETSLFSLVGEHQLLFNFMYEEV